MNRSLALVLVTFGIAMGCSGAAVESKPDNEQTGEGGAPGTSGSTATSVAASSGSGSAASEPLGALIDKDLTLSGDVEMPQISTVAAGVTLTLSPGAKLLAAKDTSLIVKGRIVADATDTAPVVFQSKEHMGPNGWVGLVLQDGGEANLKHVEIHDAKLALNAGAGSKFAIDHILVQASAKIAALSSSGTIDHGKLHGLGEEQKAFGSPITVDTASPKVSNTIVDNADDKTDHIIVDGAGSAPVFDHMEISQCHCAFHFAKGTGATISNSNVHDSLYGLMVLGSKGTKITASNFIGNQINVGLCQGGDVTVTGSYFDDMAFDTSCAMQANNTPSMTQLTDVGPQP